MRTRSWTPTARGERRKTASGQRQETAHGELRMVLVPVLPSGFLAPFAYQGDCDLRRYGQSAAAEGKLFHAYEANP
jgi:hypothetical protein